MPLTLLHLPPPLFPLPPLALSLISRGSHPHLLPKGRKTQGEQGLIVYQFSQAITILKIIIKARFKHCATAVLSWLNCSSTAA